MRTNLGLLAAGCQRAPRGRPERRQRGRQRGLLLGSQPGELVAAVAEEGGGPVAASEIPARLRHRCAPPYPMIPSTLGLTGSPLSTAAP